jgi:uncharacterized membrane protein
MDITSAIAGLAVFVALVAGAYLLITRGTRVVFGPRRRLEEEAALGQLRHRLSRGEITPDEFEQAKRAIGR